MRGFAQAGAGQGILLCAGSFRGEPDVTDTFNHARPPCSDAVYRGRVGPLLPLLLCYTSGLRLGRPLARAGYNVASLGWLYVISSTDFAFSVFFEVRARARLVEDPLISGLRRFH